MEKIIASIILSVAVTILMAPSALAQKPDGETPANASVCDVLHEATPGLHGLCVAFCEVQDHPNILAAITEQEIHALEDAAPSGRLLANYNKKKKAGDPDMPCMNTTTVTDPCPCWAEAELAEIDGVMWDGTASSSDSRWEPDGRWCYDITSSESTNIFALEAQRAADRLDDISTVAQIADTSVSQQCAFNRIRNGHDGITTAITLTVDKGTLTAGELAACTASLRDFQVNSGFCP